MPARSELIAPLLAPIEGDNPAGRWVRDEPVYETIKDARREDDDADQGDWQRTRKVADHGQVITLTAKLLATASKDAQLAVWWTESMLKREGVLGLRDGVALLRGLFDQYWDTLYPEIEDGDASLRAGPLDYVGMKLVDALRASPINQARHALFQYEAASVAGTEEDADSSDARTAARAALSAKEQPLIEAVLASVDSTPTAWYRTLNAAITETIEDVNALDSMGNDRFGDDAPSFRRLLDALEQMQRAASALLSRRQASEPVSADGPGDAGGAGGGADGVFLASGVPGTASLSLQPTSDADAVQRIVGAARYLRRAQPTDAVPYALLRTLRWQELRSAGRESGVPPAAMLIAPPTADRSRLKSLLLDQRHEELLDGAEELLGATGGGAWLDAQRWAMEAATALGPDYAAVRQAMHTALRQLLMDCPRLPQATLLDESPVASAETLAWLDRDGLTASAPSSEAPKLDGLAALAHRPMLQRAQAEVAAGRLDKGVALLMGDMARERSERARFLRRIELVTILVNAGRAEVAMPTVDEMLAQIDTHKLDAWEDGGVVAQALVLACRAIDATDGDMRQRAELYLRVCRLDPIAALALSA